MYLHIGGNSIVKNENVIGVFDLDSVTISKRTREYLESAQKKDIVINISDDVPRSFILCADRKGETVYLSQISSQTLYKRMGSGIFL